MKLKESTFRKKNGTWVLFLKATKKLKTNVPYQGKFRRAKVLLGKVFVKQPKFTHFSQVKTFASVFEVRNLNSKI